MQNSINKGNLSVINCLLLKLFASLVYFSFLIYFFNFIFPIKIGRHLFDRQRQQQTTQLTKQFIIHLWNDCWLKALMSYAKNEPEAWHKKIWIVPDTFWTDRLLSAENSSCNLWRKLEISSRNMQLHQTVA